MLIQNIKFHMISKFRKYSLNYNNYRRIMYSINKEIQNIGDRVMYCFQVINEEDETIIIDFYDKGFKQITGFFKKTIIYDFELSFMLKQPNKIHFKRGNQQLNYVLVLEGDDNINQLTQYLRKRIKQLDFNNHFLIGKQIANYKGTVYQVLRLKTRTKYALKKYQNPNFFIDNMKQSFIQFIEVMRTLNHKNIIKLYQIFQTQHQIFFILQFLQGGNLASKIKEKYKFRLQEIQFIMKGVLLGLRQMHSKKIMHSDIRPENLLFRKNGDFDCVIGDLRLSEFYVSHKECINTVNKQRKYIPSYDIFSLGLVFYHLQLGRELFPGSTYYEYKRYNKSWKFGFSIADREKICPKALNLLQRMLTKNNNERITAKQGLQHPFFYDELEKCIIPRVKSKKKIKDKDKNNKQNIIFPQILKEESFYFQKKQKIEKNYNKNELQILRRDSKTLSLYYHKNCQKRLMNSPSKAIKN